MPRLWREEIVPFVVQLWNHPSVTWMVITRKLYSYWPVWFHASVNPPLTSQQSPFCQLIRWLKIHKDVVVKPFVFESELAYCLDLFLHVLVNIEITNQAAYYNGCQPRPSAENGKIMRRNGWDRWAICSLASKWLQMDSRGPLCKLQELEVH